ncbi:MAG: hypothetical protein JO182_30335 [Acidobacteriaceae bacterium]|nr:hypothetical protein [Acidobacteriaceae bacterium]MBV9222402.1 hypothetical protein [Acidobacteriaceae bacterium]MBV9305285.1 hypothetical protein [Acidobacteriaceae bacterium]MBV9938026.1 hypothetical protein [Acidobacteriaceae bacterium]
MGVLIEMPVRNQTDIEATVENHKAAAGVETSTTDFSVWTNAPKERTVAYFPTYSAISKTMQTAMRGWVREWFFANPEVLLRPHTAYPILVFQCTHPFAGKPTNIFTYDIQQTEALNRAFASAASKLGRELKALNTQDCPWLTREHYFAYRSKEVVKYVMKNRKAIYKMLNVETMLMDSILKFAVIDIPKLGLEEALVLLRRAFNTQLHRFSEQFDLSTRTEELLRIATDVLKAKISEEKVVEMPQRKGNVVQMPRRNDAVVEMPLAA